MVSALRPGRRFAAVLDLGCGTGLNAPLWAAQCEQLVGVDLSEAMLRQAAARGGYTELARGDLDELLPKMERTFDLVVATDTAHRHVHSLLTRAPLDGELSLVTDVTGAFAQINLQGPLSRAVLSAVTSEDLSDAAFPFRAAREIDVGCARVLATRITYVRPHRPEAAVCRPAAHACHAP